MPSDVDLLTVALLFAAGMILGFGLAGFIKLTRVAWSMSDIFATLVFLALAFLFVISLIILIAYHSFLPIAIGTGCGVRGFHFWNKSKRTYGA